MADEYVRMKKSTLTAIGDAIRSKEGSTELIPPLEMSARIEALSGNVNFDTIVEVEENSFTDCIEVHEYFVSKIQTEIFLLCYLGQWTVQIISVSLWWEALAEITKVLSFE